MFGIASISALSARSCPSARERKLIDSGHTRLGALICSDDRRPTLRLGLSWYGVGGLGRMSLIKTNETPRAAFATSEKFRGSPNREIPRMLWKYLRDLFPGSAKPMKILWFPWMLDVKSEHCSVAITLARSKVIKNGWRLMVASRSLLPFHIHATERLPRYDPAVFEVCRAIHSFLAQTTGIVDLRWYFQSSGSQTPAVGTPDELPWHES